MLNTCSTDAQHIHSPRELIPPNSLPLHARHCPTDTVSVNTEPSTPINELVTSDYYDGRKALAVALGLGCERTLVRLEQRGDGPPVTRIPGTRKILYRKAAVRQWLLEREQGRKRR
jgi:hypothetical protein